MPTIPQILRRSAAVIGLVLLVVTACALLIVGRDVLLLTVLAVLFAIFLVRVAGFIPLPRKIAVLAILLILLTALGSGMTLFGLRIEQQTYELASQVDRGIENLRQLSQRNRFLRAAVESLPLRKVWEDPGSLKELARPETGSRGSVSLTGLLGGALTNLGQVFQSALGAGLNVLFVVFVGLFLALEPEVYRDGLVKLFHPDVRTRTREVLDKLDDTLWHWLLGQSVTMLITGVGTGVAMWLLGVPFAFALGVLTGLLTFIPNLGAAMALTIATLSGLSQGIDIAGWVVVVFLGFQLLESYVITPLIQYHQVLIPPALLIVVQLLSALLGGFLGLMVATPLLAGGMVLVKELYLQDTLGEAEGAGGQA